MKKKYTYWIILGLIIVCILSFGRIAGNDFINFDDHGYITENTIVLSGLSCGSVKKAFTTVVESNWVPLSILSHMLDWSLFGANPAGHHIVSLLLHIGAVLFLFLFMYKTTNQLWASAFAVAFFALHPLRVESVAWASERKDVLSMFFGMASLYAYAFYVKDSRIYQYCICLILFALGLLSKSILVTLPFVFLLMDYWPLGRWNKTVLIGKNRALIPPGRLIAEKIPFFLLTVIFSIITFVAQHEKESVYPPVLERISNALVAYGIYLQKTFWPFDLALFYLSVDSFPLWRLVTSGFVLAGITFVVLSKFRKMPYLFTGWFWYLGTLVPMIGLVPTNALTADHYTYLPSIGIAMMLAWGISAWVKNAGFRHLNRKVLWPAGLVVLILLAFLAFRQAGLWKNSIILWHHAVEATENNSLAYNSLASALVDAERIDEAIENYNKAIRIRPDAAEFYHDRGIAYAKLNQHHRAIEDYNEAIRIRPETAEFYSSRGDAYAALDQYHQAIKNYNDAVRLSPDSSILYYNRGSIHGEFDNFQYAVEDFGKAIRINPGFVDAYFNRGAAYAKMGRYSEAIEDFNRTINLDRDYSMAYYSRGYAYLLQGNEEGCPDAHIVCDWGECRLLDFSRSKGLCD